MRRLLVYSCWFLGLAIFLNSCGKDSGSTPTPEPEPPVSTGLKFPKKEMRAAWFASVWSLDWPQKEVGEAAQKQKYTRMLDSLQTLKFNTVIFQVKGMADAFYNSPYEPWSAAISGTRGVDPGYDILKFLIDETHARGMEFHAWMNPYRIATRAEETNTFAPLPHTIPASWVIDLPKIRIYNPAMPEVRERLNNIVRDLIQKFDVDGIHFDDYFYPSGFSYNDDADYAKYGAAYPRKEDFRRGNVDKAIEGVYKTILATKPQVVFSVSPAASRSYNFNTMFADVPKWTAAGWVDVLIPQLYQEIGNQYNPFEGNLSDWASVRGKAQLVIGHGLYKFGDNKQAAAFQSTVELVKQIDLVRKNKFTVGSGMYSARDVMANKIGVADKLKELYNSDAVIPFAGREVAPKPAVPTNLVLNGSELSWTVTGSNLKTVVYHFSDLKATGKVVGVTSNSKMNVTEKGFYCVTTINVDNLESTATTTIEKK
ncbi:MULTISPECIES: glycoside hydrolase family 10 protein [Sphingobacterium]|uniref:glycoside hydrolase family 10 protein n=1 Tax=Sphingobacterium TaxID=28453 RepID=UPI0013D9F533|nr:MULTISPECIES: family 10 glycosylhydrolase [unclassified Sphingobacterium]